MKKRVVSIGAVLLAAATIAACSSSGSGSNSATHSGSRSSSSGSPASTAAASGSSAASYATAEIAKYSNPTTWRDPGPSVNGAAASGKKVMYIGAQFASTTIDTIANALRDALSRVGATTEFCDAKGTPDGWTKCMQEGVGQHVDAIVADSFPLTQVGPQLQAAKAAHIPVLSANSEALTGPLYPNTSGRVAFPFALGGKLLADYVIADSNANADALILTTGDLPAAGVLLGGLQAEFQAHCPNCKLTVKSIPIAGWATQLAPTTSSVLVADPAIKYVIPVFDDMVPFVQSAITQQGAARKVKVATFNADIAAMQLLAKGQLVTYEVGTDNPYNGWAQADQLIRIFAGKQPVQDELIPIRAFTKNNIGSITVSQSVINQGSWYIDPKVFQQGYLKLWGK